MGKPERVSNKVILVLLLAALTTLSIGATTGNSSLMPPPPVTTPDAPPNELRPEPLLTDEARAQIKRQRSPSPWGPHTAGSTIEIAGQQVQLPEDVHVAHVIAHGICDPDKTCVDTPAWVLQRGDSLFSIGKQSGRPAPGREIPEAFNFLRRALR